MDKDAQKKIGIIVTVIGISCLILFQVIKFSNQPIMVTSAMGTGYMGGWSRQTISMVNTFSIISVIDITLGLLMVFQSKKK